MRIHSPRRLKGVAEKTLGHRAASADAPTGLRPPARGCRFGYPGTWEGNNVSTAKRLRHLYQRNQQSRRNRVAVEGINRHLFPG